MRLQSSLLQVVERAADRFQRRAGEVGVDLGGAAALVAEKFLDDAQVRPALQEMGGEAVTEGVRRQVLGDAGQALPGS